MKLGCPGWGGAEHVRPTGGRRRTLLVRFRPQVPFRVLFRGRSERMSIGRVVATLVRT